LRTPAKVEHAVNAQSTFPPDNSYVVPTTGGIDKLLLTPSEIGLVREAQRKNEYLHFGYVAQRESFGGGVTS
jgi:hypothetical protein